VAVEFRNKLQNKTWKKMWDTCFFIGSIMTAFFVGIVFSNIFRGVSIDGAGVYQGSILAFLNPYALLGGLVFIILFVLHGAEWLAIKSDGDLGLRAKYIVKKSWTVLFAAMILFVVASVIATDLLENYLEHPILLLVPSAIVAAEESKLKELKSFLSRIPIVVVKDTRFALGELAKYYRNKFSITVVGGTQNPNGDRE
jgi:cytochrome d ubiquinol oxidase subunit II